MWNFNVYSMVSHIIHRCVICYRLRRKLGFPKIFVLPEERCMEVTQITYKGFDMFIPEVNCYDAFFTRFYSSDLHIELSKNIDVDSFIMKLCRSQERRSLT